MEVLTPVSGHLCNYEVLTFLIEKEAHTRARIDQYKKERAERVARNEEDPNIVDEAEEVKRFSEGGMRTVVTETISHLSHEPHPTLRQTSEGISRLLDYMDNLPESQTLYKTEKLMIANLAPTQDVEAHVIIEELEHRFTDDQLQDLLSTVSSSLLEEPQTSLLHPAQAAATGAATAQEGARDTLERTLEEADKELDKNWTDEMDEEMGDLVQEGLGGGMDRDVADIDEVAES